MVKNNMKKFFISFLIYCILTSTFLIGCSQNLQSKQDERFEVIYTENNGFYISIIKDLETGVKYLACNKGICKLENEP